jgi:hypothetical protein
MLQRCYCRLRRHQHMKMLGWERLRHSSTLPDAHLGTVAAWGPCERRPLLGSRLLYKRKGSFTRPFSGLLTEHVIESNRSTAVTNRKKLNPGGAETKMRGSIELGRRNKRHGGAPGGTGHLVACPLAGGASSWRG